MFLNGGKHRKCAPCCLENDLLKATDYPFLRRAERNQEVIVMQIKPGSGREGVRLTILLPCLSLTIGAAVWLMVSFRPVSSSPLPAEPVIVERQVAAHPGSVRAVMGNPLVTTPLPGGVGRVSVPVNPAMVTAGANGNRSPRPIIIPELTEKNRIVGPVPWRNGPPVRTPLPGSPTAKASGTPVPNRLAVPNAVNGNGNRRALPFMPPARNNAAPPAPPLPPVNATDGKGSDGN